MQSPNTSFCFKINEHCGYSLGSDTHFYNFRAIQFAGLID